MGRDYDDLVDDEAFDLAFPGRKLRNTRYCYRPLIDRYERAKLKLQEMRNEQKMKETAGDF